MKHKTKKLIYNSIVGVLLSASIIYLSSKFLHLGRIEYTDNAQVKQLILPINSRIQGFVKKIYFKEYQKVNKGDTLAVIEDSEFKYRLAQAIADYHNASKGKIAISNTISTTQNNIYVSDAAIDEAKVRLDNSEREYLRYKNIYEKKAVTWQIFDQISTNYKAMQARYNQMLRQKQTTQLIKKEQSTRLDQSEAVLNLAKAAVDLAKLNLSYTVIISPCNGITGRKNLQEGQLIQPGQTIVDIVDSNDKWIVANYRETQTKNIKEGKVVNIKIDAIPNTIFKGYVKSISGATGSSFSIMPLDNSSGNFIKVEQRIPIRIEFSSNNPQSLELIRAGMNVECSVVY